MNWLDAPIWQPFKWTPTNTHAHSGIDLGMKNGTPITAPMPGMILSSGHEPWGGQVNELVSINGQPYVLSWLHLSSLEPMQPGQTVQPGQTLGYSGTPPPGYGSGAHTHFEVTHGTLAPYMGYSPWHPTKTSYPVNPATLLTGWRNGVTTLALQTNGNGSTASAGCVHSVSIFPGQTFCLDGGINFAIRGGIVLAGVVLILAALAIFAAGNSGVRDVVKTAAPLAAA